MNVERSASSCFHFLCKPRKFVANFFAPYNCNKPICEGNYILIIDLRQADYHAQDPRLYKIGHLLGKKKHVAECWSQKIYNKTHNYNATAQCTGQKVVVPQRNLLENACWNFGNLRWIKKFIVYFVIIMQRETGTIISYVS